ncbi:MAG: nitroreductase family protein [Oscillospiraceae bacterium]|jgi:nitroreductase|nr:nitroreductase family protein [Oscillospiraceae bacterium]
MEALEAVLGRKTIREYTPERIDNTRLRALLSAAERAPSGRNAQPCHVRFTQNAVMLQKMQVDFKNIVGWDTPVHTRSDKNPFYHNAPLFAFIFAEREAPMDAGIMAENIAIAARAVGLESVIVGSVGALFSDAAAGAKWRQALDIPPDYPFMVGIGIGCGDEDPPFKDREPNRIKIIE